MHIERETERKRRRCFTHPAAACLFNRLRLEFELNDGPQRTFIGLSQRDQDFRYFLSSAKSETAENPALTSFLHPDASCQKKQIHSIWN